MHHPLFYRSSTEIYIKEVSRHLCMIDYTWVGNVFKHVLTAALEALSLMKEEP
jgi:hypothetical protein